MLGGLDILLPLQSGLLDEGVPCADDGGEHLVGLVELLESLLTSRPLTWTQKVQIVGQKKKKLFN